MPHPAAFEDAHSWHWTDAELLFEHQRWAGADQLYGFSTECGLKAVMRALMMAVDGEGGPRDEVPKKHVHELWNRFRTFARGRVEASYLADLPQSKWAQVVVDGSRLFCVPRELIAAGERQRRLFHAIAGDWMGRDRRRGFPYTWVPSHLADADRRVSPRSFLVALRKAADDTEDRYREHGKALHYESIKRGVQEASRVRVQELQEDYPWVHRLLQPLQGMVVPCGFDEVVERWESGRVLERLGNDIGQNEVKLPPAHFDGGHLGIRQDLESLGIFTADPGRAGEHPRCLPRRLRSGA